MNFEYWNSLNVENICKRLSSEEKAYNYWSLLVNKVFPINSIDDIEAKLHSNINTYSAPTLAQIQHKDMDWNGWTCHLISRVLSNNRLKNYKFNLGVLWPIFRPKILWNSIKNWNQVIATNSRNASHKWLLKY